MSDDENSEWLIQILRDVQLEHFYVRIRDELQVTNKYKNIALNRLNIFVNIILRLSMI